MVLGLAHEALAVIPTTTVAPLIISGRQSARPAGTYSAGIAEIIKLLDAKIDAQVILAYIQTSPIPYNPDAAELIALREHGASTEMLTALLHHGDELRLQLAQAQSAVNPQPAAPAYDYAPEGAYPAYPCGYPDSSCAPYPATYYSYAYGWPSAYWPSVRISRCWPYSYPHGRFSAPHAPYSVSAASSGHRCTLAAHSNGSRGSGRSGGRSAGRSR